MASEFLEFLQGLNTPQDFPLEEDLEDDPDYLEEVIPHSHQEFSEELRADYGVKVPCNDDGPFPHVLLFSLSSLSLSDLSPQLSRISLSSTLFLLPTKEI